MSVADRISNRSFLVDSGADECVFPATPEDRALPTTSSLVAANGSTIHTFGKRTMPISLATGHLIQHSFWIATVQRPILGADFFKEHRLLIDLPRCRVVSYAGDIFPAAPSKAPAVAGLHLPTDGPFESILDEFPGLLRQSFKDAVKHNVEHHIQTSGPPIHTRPRRLDSEKLRVAKAEFATMEDLGIIKRSDSPWASPHKRR